MSTKGEGAKMTRGTKAKIGAIVGAVAATAVILAVVLLNGEDSYRTIAVEEVNGTTLVASNGKEAVSAYEGMHLYSGDDVSVQQDSDMTMVLDMDKYVYAEPGTHFWLECEGKEEDSRTVIYLEEGSVLNRLKDNLNEGEVYQVDTPNSTMAVRGTVFRVTVYRGEDGLVYTLLEVFEGQVQADLKTEEGEYNGVSEIFEPGDAALIRGNSDFSEFVPGKEDSENAGSTKLEIAYKEIPQSTAKVLVEYIDAGEELCIEKELLMDYTQLVEHRMETREGKKSTCTEAGYEEIWCVVCNEVTETVKLPLLEHEPGEWKVTMEPTCQEAGSRQRVCDVCGAVCEKEEIERLGHQAGPLQTLTSATCTGTGGQTVHCELCGEELQHVVTDALGHTAGGTTIVKNASCKEEGLSRSTCTVCGIVLSENSIAKTGHNWGSWTTVSTGNCNSQGVERRTCSSCGSTEEQTTGGGRGNHNMSWEITVEATCETDGQETGTCTECGATDTRVIASNGHNMVLDETSFIEATCGAAGKEVSICSVCGTTESKEIPATGKHEVGWYGNEESDMGAACVNGGIVYGICFNCDAEVIKEIAAGEHMLISEHDRDVMEEGHINCIEWCYLCGKEIARADNAQIIFDSETGYEYCGNCGNIVGPN